MDKFLKELKRNKYTTITIIVFILFIFLGYGVYNFLIPNSGTPVYGNRLDGIEKVEITSSNLKELDEKIMENEIVVSSSSNVNGKIVNILVTVKEKTKLSTAKKITTTVKEFFTEEQLKYYDFQIFLDNEDESFSVIGYKNKNNDNFVF